MTPEGDEISWGTTGDGSGAWGPGGADPIAFDESIGTVAWNPMTEAPTGSLGDGTRATMPWHAVAAALLPDRRRYHAAVETGGY